MRLTTIPTAWESRVAGPDKAKPKRQHDKASEFFALLKLLHPDELGHWLPEHRFYRSRRWRFDAADADAMVAVEIDGGAYTNGRHNRGSGMDLDNEKINTAIVCGWVVFRFTPQMLKREPQKCLGQVVTVAQARRS